MKKIKKMLIATGLFAIGTSIVLSYNLINNQNNKNNDIINENLNNNQSKQDQSYFDENNKTLVVKDSKMDWSIVRRAVQSVGKNLSDIEYAKIEINGVVLSTDTFKDCTNLVSIEGSEKIEYMHESVFKNCSKLTSIDLPNLIGSLQPYDFQGCTSLTSITLGNKVKYIGASAFEGTGISQIDLPNGLESIGECI